MALVSRATKRRLDTGYFEGEREDLSGQAIATEVAEP